MPSFAKQTPRSSTSTGYCAGTTRARPSSMGSRSTATAGILATADRNCWVLVCSWASAPGGTLAETRETSRPLMGDAAEVPAADVMAVEGGHALGHERFEFGFRSLMPDLNSGRR